MPKPILAPLLLLPNYMHHVLVANCYAASVSVDVAMRRIHDHIVDWGKDGERMMVGIPPVVDHYVRDHIVAARMPAYLWVDAAHCLQDWGGATAAYGLTGLQVGRAVDEQLTCLSGLLPLAESSLRLCWVELQADCYADVHLIADESGVWVLLLNATAEAVQHGLMQQKVNEANLDSTTASHLWLQDQLRQAHEMSACEEL